MKVAGISVGFSEFPVSDQWSVNIYISGCENACEDCHNSYLSDFAFGTSLSANSLFKTVNDFSLRIKTKSVCFLGGDPLHPRNINETLDTAKKLKNANFHICVYTGYTLDELKKMFDAKQLDELYENIDFLKTGRYIKSLAQTPGKLENKLVLGSSNQEFYEILNTNPTLISNSGIATIRETY